MTANCQHLMTNTSRLDARHRAVAVFGWRFLFFQRGIVSLLVHHFVTKIYCFFLIVRSRRRFGLISNELCLLCTISFAVQLLGDLWDRFLRNLHLLKNATFWISCILAVKRLNFVILLLLSIPKLVWVALDHQLVAIGLLFEAWASLLVFLQFWYKRRAAVRERQHAVCAELIRNLWCLSVREFEGALTCLLVPHFAIVDVVAALLSIPSFNMRQLDHAWLVP